MKFPITPNTYTEKELKQAYSITVPDLFQKLVKAKTNQTIQIGSLGSLGSFKKSEQKIKSALDGNTYVFYRIKFTPSSKLKVELNKALEVKWNQKKYK